MTSPSSPAPNLEDVTRQPSVRLTDLTLFSAASSSSALKSKELPFEPRPSTDTSREKSLKVFRRWLTKGGTDIDASEVVSKACFDDWCLGRSCQSSAGLSRSFQMVLTAHITGSGGRQPFQHDEEAAILKVIRKKQIWPAFKGTKLTIGCRGFRGHGYHEKLCIPLYSSTESLTPQQQLVARYEEDPTFSKRSRATVKAKAKRRSAEIVLPQNKFFRQAENEYPSIPQQFWMHTQSTLPAASTYSQPYDLMSQNQIAFSPLLGVHNQPLVVPNGYFKPMTFHLSHVLNEQTIAPGRLAFDNGQHHD